MYAQMPIRLRRASFALNRYFLAALFLAALILAVLTFAFPLAAQETGQTTGVSQPPANESYETNDPAPPAKPSPSKYANTTTPAAQPELLQSAPINPEQTSADTNSQPAPETANQPAAKPRTADPDEGIVGDTPMSADNSRQSTSPAHTATEESTLPSTLNARANADPDGDMVQPRVAGPGEILEGTTIRVRLVDRLSSANTSEGSTFKSRVASDVLSNGQVLIPTGSEIDGQVIKVSSGEHLGSSGYMRLRPETVILPDGSSYHIASTITGTPGSRTKLNDEGTIKAGSRFKRDGIEYAGVVTAGTVTGAFIGGPVGAVTGGAVGAGVVTTHLLVNHAQAVLEPGTVLMITLTSPLRMNPQSMQAQN